MYRPFRVNGCNETVCLLGNHIIIVEEVGCYAVKLVDISSEVNAVTVLGAEDIADIAAFYLEHRMTDAVIDEVLVHRTDKEPFQ